LTVAEPTRSLTDVAPKSVAESGDRKFERYRFGSHSVDDMTRIFTHWPAAIPKEGTVVTSHGESIPFNEYMLSNELLLLMRPQPDQHGTRRIIMKLKDIVGVRLATAIDAERFLAMGFQKHSAPPPRRAVQPVG